MKYTVFGSTGLRVPQLALGTGNFGTGWGHGADPDVSKAIFNTYAEAGGSFIDTADAYQFGQSEELLGSLLEGRRENFVLATKFTRGAVPNADRLVTGNSRKAMVASLEASLKRLASSSSQKRRRCRSLRNRDAEWHDRATSLSQVILDGFFARTALDHLPRETRRTGLQEFGLPYASDPVISKHLPGQILPDAECELEETSLLEVELPALPDRRLRVSGSPPWQSLHHTPD